MSEIKGEPTTTETIKQAETAQAIDTKGRVITVKRLNALDYYRITKILGEATQATIDMASLACAVRKIDITDYAFPTTERELEFLIQQLDFDGFAAVGEALKKLIPDADK